jgi:tetratricopeptide (TPR) repeat protein
MRKTIHFLIGVFFLLFLPLQAEKTIGIFTYLTPGAQPWDPDSVKSGITGSEEAVIYISKQLASLGYKVTVFGAPPENSSHSLETANPRYVPLSFREKDPLDIAIVWRIPTWGEQLKTRAKQLYFWPHDTWTSPLTEAQINAFDDVLWLSDWQQKQWASANPGFSKFKNIFGNGINPEQFKAVSKRKNPYSCIYSSNYGRGLEQLLDIWPTVKKEFPKATLDIYYGWQHWGLLSAEKEEKMKKQIQELAALGVKEHGMVSHEKLNQALSEASFWTYPCSQPEVFCITAIRAQLSGAVPVIIKHSALPETTQSGYSCTNPEEYLPTLQQAMRKAKKISLSDRKKMGEFVLSQYTWKKIASKWKDLFDLHTPISPKKKALSLAVFAENDPQDLIKTLSSLKDKIDSWILIDKSSDQRCQQIISNYYKDTPGRILIGAEGKSDFELLKEAFSTDPHSEYVLLLESGDELFCAEDISLSDLKEDAYCSFLSPDRPFLVKQQWIHSPGIKAALLPGIIRSKELQGLTNEINPTLVKALRSFYFAQSYLQSNQLEKAFKHHTEIVNLKEPLLRKSPSFYYLGVLGELLSKSQEEILSYYSSAYQENPVAEPLFRLAAYYLKIGKPVLGYAMAKLALSSPRPEKSLFGEDWIYDHGLSCILGNCAFEMGHYLEAKQAYAAALARPSLNPALREDIEKNLHKISVLETTR